MALRRSIRLKLIAIVVLCAIGALSLPIPIDLADVYWHRTPRDYLRGMERIDSAAQAMAHALDEPQREASEVALQRLSDTFEREFRSGPLSVRLVDRDGHVVLKAGDGPAGDVDLLRTLRTAAAQRADPALY